MFGKGGVPYAQKFLGCCTIIMIITIIILAMVGNFGGESDAKVEMSGDNGEALLQQSSGLHLVEVNGADLGSINGKEKWSWMEYLCVVLGFIFFSKFHSHCTLLLIYKENCKEEGS